MSKKPKKQPKKPESAVAEYEPKLLAEKRKMLIKAAGKNKKTA